jgi:hypothetical protein
MRFWDSSAVIPLCIDEPQSPAVRKIAREDEALVVWWASEVECYSALARLLREGHLAHKDGDRAAALLDALSVSWSEIEPSDDIRDSARRLLRNHPLRAADALQLAAALIWSNKSPRGHYFVCLDDRLRGAARKEGFSLLPAEPEG